MIQKNNYLGCDDIDDAIRSLALFYGVNSECIRDLYQSNWPDFLPEDTEPQEFYDLRLVWCIATCLGLKNFISPVGFEAAFYHRTRFNGDSEWFVNGLLTAQDGMHSFFDKIEPRIGHEPWFKTARAVALCNLKDRNELEKTTGPHAYDHFYDAAYGEGKRNFSVPEFCIGSIWDKCAAQEESNQFRLFCEKNLQPVIVKFLAKPSCVDQYVMHLWFFLFKQRFQVEYTRPLTGCFVGGGRAIPKTKFIELITNF